MEFNRPLFPVASPAPLQQLPRRRGPPIRQASIALARARLLEDTQPQGTPSQTQPQDPEITTTTAPQVLPQTRQPVQEPTPVQMQETLSPTISTNGVAPQQPEMPTPKETLQPATTISGTSPVQLVPGPLQPAQLVPVPVQPVQPVTAPIQSSTMLQEKSQSITSSPRPALPTLQSETNTNSSSFTSSQSSEETNKQQETPKPDSPTYSSPPSSTFEPQSTTKLQEATQPATVINTTGYSLPKETSQSATAEVTSSSLRPALITAEISPKLQEEASQSAKTTYATDYSLPQSQVRQQLSTNVQEPLQSSMTTDVTSSSQPTSFPHKTSPKLDETSELATSTTNNVSPPPSDTKIHETLQMTTNATNFSTESTRSQTSSPQPDSIPRLAIADKLPTHPESPKIIKSSPPTPPLSPGVDQPDIFTSLTSNPKPETKSPKPLPEPKGVIIRSSTNRNGTKVVNSNEKGEPTKTNHNSNSDDQPIASQADMKVTPPLKKEKIVPTPNAISSNAAAVIAERKKENQMTFLTIAGQNLGASVEFGAPYHHHQGRKQLHHTKVHESELSSKDINSSERKTSNSTPNIRPIMSLANNNVQTINNSILLNASCNQHNPGVHIKISSRHQHKTNKSK